MSEPQKIKKILMTADSIGGIWNFSLDLASGLSKHNIEVHLAVMGGPLNARQKREAGVLLNLRIYEGSYKLEWMNEPWQDVDEAGGWLLKLESEIEPDIIHLNGYSHASFSFSAPKLVVAHSCVYSWFKAVWNQTPPLKWNEYYGRIKEGLSNADMIIAPTAAMLKYIEDFYGKMKNAKVIYNGRNPDKYVPHILKENIIFSAGRLWDEAKNITALADAADKISAPVYIAGDTSGPFGNTLEFGNVNFLGVLSEKDIASWMGRSAIYALPARYEPFGLSILEAALSKCALVLGDIGTLRELWDGAAVFVQAGDNERLAYEINTLLNDPDKRTKLVEKSYKRALQFPSEATAVNYLKTYNEVCSYKSANIIL